MDAGQGLVFWSWLKFLEFFDVTNGPIFTILGWCVYDTYVLDRIKCCSCVKGFGWWIEFSEQVPFDDYKLLLILSSSCWCILWYWWTSQPWMLNLDHRFRMLDEGKVFRTGALWYTNFSYYWFNFLKNKYIHDASCDDDTFLRLRCWIWAFRKRLRLLELVTCLFKN